jgi:LuxR family maltose regulon positive regulatory protein
MRSSTYGTGGILIDRPGLESLMARAKDHAITLVWGPPGSGKHTLLDRMSPASGVEQWTARVASGAGNDGEQQGALRFEITDSVDPGPIGSLSEFVEQWRRSPRDGVLFLDGTRLEPHAWKAMLPADLLANLPHGLRVVLVARARPRLALERHRMSGALLEIGADDFCLDRRESERLVEATGISILGPEATDAIHRISQGWMAGIHLCALHARSCPDPERALRTFGENPHLHQYLMQEILEGLPPALQWFLSDASILARIAPEACDPILERSGSAAALIEIGELTPLVARSHDGIWQIHPLVRAGLERMLFARDPDRYRALHRRAARWHLASGMAEQAVVHALEARDPETLESVAERALQNLFRDSDFLALQKHARQFLPSMVHDRPFLSLFLAWALFHMGREREGAEHLERARELAIAIDPEASDPRRESILAHEAFLRSILLRLDGDFAASVEVAKAGMASCGKSRPFLSASFLVQVAVSQFLSGATEASETTLREAMDRATMARHHLAYYGAGYSLCEILMLRGRLDLAHGQILSQRTMVATDSTRRRPVWGYLEISTSRLELLQGNLDTACEAAERGIQLGRECDNIRILNYGLAARAEIAALTGDLDTAARALDEAVAVARRTRMHWAVDHDDLEAKRMRLLLPRLPDSILHSWLARRLPGIETPVVFRHDEFRTAMRILTCMGRIDEAMRLGKSWRKFFAENQLRLPLVETEYALSLANAFQGRKEDAVQRLDSALMLAASQGIASPFLHGPELDGIRREAFSAWFHRHGGVDPMATALASRVAPTQLGEVVKIRPSVQERPDGSLLSERELEVLQALRDGRSNKEIADRLFVAESTVKTHLKNIFAKLDVTNRTHAVSLAVEKGVI